MKTQKWFERHYIQNENVKLAYSSDRLKMLRTTLNGIFESALF